MVAGGEFMKQRSVFVLVSFLVFYVVTFGQTKAPTTKPAPSPTPSQTVPKPATPAPTDSEAVLAAFNKLLNGIRHADVKAVTAVYWNSPRLSLFNYNGTVTKG